MEIFSDSGRDGLLHRFNHLGVPIGAGWPIELDATRLGKVIADINADGNIDISDVLLALRMAVALSVEIEGEPYASPYPEWLVLRADYNSDGDVDIADVMLILRKSIGLD